MTDLEFETIFREQFKPLCNLAFTVVKNSDEAKDIVQQVFLNFWHRRHDLTIKGSARAYFYKAVLNNAITSLNKSKKLISLEKVMQDKLHEGESADTDDLLIEQIYLAIGELPEVCQKVFRLSRFTDMTNKEISEEFNISVKAVEKHITKALKTLRDKFKSSKLYEELMNAIIIFLFLIKGVGYFEKF